MYKEYCLSQEHLERLEELIRADKTHTGDIERISLFYIIAGNTDLYKKRKNIYDMEDRAINPFCLEEIDFCTSSRRLILFGFQLYNNFHVEQSIMELFRVLDTDNSKLAINAIRLRFNC